MKKLRPWGGAKSEKEGEKRMSRGRQNWHWV